MSSLKRWGIILIFGFLLCIIYAFGSFTLDYYAGAVTMGFEYTNNITIPSNPFGPGDTHVISISEVYVTDCPQGGGTGTLTLTLINSEENCSLEVPVSCIFQG